MNVKRNSIQSCGVSFEEYSAESHKGRLFFYLMGENVVRGELNKIRQLDECQTKFYSE
jgi:hypothetical protein